MLTHPLCIFALLKMLYTQKQADTRYQVRRIEWFDNVIIGACIETGDFIFKRGTCGNNHNGEMTERGHDADSATEVQATFTTKEGLRDQDIRRLGSNIAVCLDERGGTLNDKYAL